MALVVTENELANVIAGVADLRRRIWCRDLDPASPAAGELASAAAELGTDEPIRRLVVLADLWTMVASDQLGALSTVVASKRNLLGVFPIARSIIEHCATLLWVLAPDMQTRTRGARAALAARRSAEETCTAMAHLTGKGSPEHVKARAALKELRGGLKQEFQLATGNEAEILGETLASPTVIVSAVGTMTGDGARTWQGIYDYLCAVANHPTLRVFDFVERDASSASLEVSDAFLARLVRACLAVYLSALDATVHYFGWNADETDEFYDLVHSILPDAPDRGNG